MSVFAAAIDTLFADPAIARVATYTADGGSAVLVRVRDGKVSVTDGPYIESKEQMAGYVSWLMLDVTPTTVDWKRNVLLNWVSPDQHAAMKTKMDLEADRLRSNNAATSFLIQQLTADEREQSVLITGRLRRQINGTDVAEPETRSYLAQFHYTGGRVHIQTFKEIANVQPGQVRVGVAGSGTVAR